jgi:predicted O-methyltransferase YrrM
MYSQSVKKLFPNSFKGWVKEHPDLANVADFILTGGNIREISVYTDIFTMLSVEEREALFQLAKANNPKHAIVELGTYAGGSAYFLGKGAELSGSSVYAIDPFDSEMDRLKGGSGGNPSYFEHTKPSREEAQENMGRNGLAGRVEMIQGFSLEVAPDWDMVVGLMFVDGNHQEAYEDFMGWRRHLAPEAVVAFHDTNFSFIGRGREDTSQAVEKLIVDQSLEVISRVDRLTCVRQYYRVY